MCDERWWVGLLNATWGRGLNVHVAALASPAPHHQERAAKEDVGNISDGYELCVLLVHLILLLSVWNVAEYGAFNFLLCSSIPLLDGKIFPVTLVQSSSKMQNKLNIPGKKVQNLSCYIHPFLFKARKQVSYPVERHNTAQNLSCYTHSFLFKTAK